MAVLYVCALLARMEVQYTINPEKMNRVLGQMKLKVTWEQLLQNYENYRPSFLPDLFRDMDLQEVERFRCVYCFKSQTLPAMRRELSTFVKEFSQLYGDTLEEVLGRMDYCLKWCNAHNLRSVPFLNWTPQFGGLVQQNQPNAQIAYMQEHRIPFYMTGVIPQ